MLPPLRIGTSGLFLLSVLPSFVSSVPLPIIPPTPFSVAPIEFTPTLALPYLNGTHSLFPADFNADSSLDLLSVDTEGNFVSWFRNPTWEREAILRINAPVHADIGDLDNDGSVDLVITSGFHGFNGSEAQTGSVDWVSNPTPGIWKPIHIGDVDFAHQSFFGHFGGADDDDIQILTVSFGSSGGTSPYYNPASFVLFVPPDNPSDPTSPPWTRVDLTSSVTPPFHAVYHTEKVPKPNGAKGSNLIVSGLEGLLLLDISQNTDKTWKVVPTLLYQTSTTVAGASSSITTLGISTHSSVFLAAIDSDPLSVVNPLHPWHGDTVSIYTHNPPDATEDDLLKAGLIRKRIYVREGGGGGAVVKVADFDGDGCEDFIVGFRGLTAPTKLTASTGKGLYIFNNVKNTPSPSSSSSSSNADPPLCSYTFTQQILSERGTNDLVIADFDGDGLPDVAAVGFSPYDDVSQQQLVIYTNEVNDSKNGNEGGEGGKGVSAGGAAAIGVVMFLVGGLVTFGALWYKNKRDLARNGGQGEFHARLYESDI